MIKAVIDVGSNSIKMRLARISHGIVHVIRDETEVVRLGKGMSASGFLQPENMKVSCESISKMVNRAKSMGGEIIIVGTMALRTAKNSSDFVEMVKAATGLEIQVLSGEQEAHYSWLGAIDGLDSLGASTMFDSGGCSTEFVSGDSTRATRLESVPIGSVTLTEEYFRDQSAPLKRSVCDRAIAHVHDLLAAHNIGAFGGASRKVIAVGGGAVTLSSVKQACENFKPSLLQGSILTRKDISVQIGMYSSLSLRERGEVIGLPEARADVILGSACIMQAVLESLGADSCVVSINGLRHGVLISDKIV